MDTAESTIKQVCEEKGIITPIEFLLQVMQGTDPRSVSTVYTTILRLEEEFGDEPPDEFEWLELVEMIKRDYRHSIVDIKASQDAAKQVLEYQHPKRKAVDVAQATATVETSELTRREIKNVRKAFDLDY